MMNRGLWKLLLPAGLLSLIIVCCVTSSRAGTYAPVKAHDTRMLNIVRRYAIAVIPGTKNTASIPAMLSFWGATNQQIIMKSSFTYSVKPNRIRITADNLGMKRRNYELTWNAPRVNKIIVTQKLLVKLHDDAVLFTSVWLPYAPGVLAACSADLRKTKTINPDNPKLVRICGKILARTKWSEEDVQLACDWIDNHVTFQSGDAGSSDQTLQTRRGNCEAMSNLACAMLRKMGIPADKVEAKIIGSRGGHAFIEAYFPDAGWVFYDPSDYQRGFESLDCLVATGWAYRVVNASGMHWYTGYFCREKDVRPYDDRVRLVRYPMRRGPKDTAIGAHVWNDPTPRNVKVRRESINAMIMDLSIPPGVTTYACETQNSKLSATTLPSGKLPGLVHH